MLIGLYGKLPSRRDFIAISASREFLAAWEPWIQGGVSASTMRLGERWKPAFLRAPIWRFWLGAEICGQTVLGAFMPSLDGVGRYFPLTLFARSETGPAILPPEIDAQEAWFEAAETLLLSTLEEGASFEATLAGLQSLGAPLSFTPAPADVLHDGTILASAAPAGFPEAFRAARIADPGQAHASSTFWWTAGSEDFPPVTLSRRLMPDPFIFIDMLTGSFGTRSAGHGEHP